MRTQRYKDTETQRRKEIFFKREINFLLRVSVSLCLCVFLLLAITSCREVNKATGKKVMILGIDGMDPRLLTEFMARGEMPNFQKLIAEGGFMPLGTSTPPQSPVAWSNFTTGANPGFHGIFDFIHRDPKKYTPYLSTSESKSADTKHAHRIGEHVFWTRGGQTLLLRKGKPFWEYLADRGIWERVFKIPSNFPPWVGRGWSGSGMGTPDILGTYGTFTFFTDYPPSHPEEIGGGTIVPVDTSHGAVRAKIPGPENIFKLDPQRPPTVTTDDAGHQQTEYHFTHSDVPITIYIDEKNPSIKIEYQDQEILLSQGEWSDWHPITFEMWWPFAPDAKGIVRFYLKQVRPYFKLYASPINMDPTDPPLPLTSPAEYGKSISHDLGYYYTQGMPENTKARQADLDVFDDGELLHQMMIVHAEDMKLLDWHLDRFHDGMLFYYIGTLDLGTHMFWRLHDPTSASYDKVWADKLGDPLEKLYIEMDGVLGHVLGRIQDPATGKIPDNTTLIVMSDHGFGPWNKSFQVNRWLLDNGYLVLKAGEKPEDVEYFVDRKTGQWAVDWSRTRAYGLGLNGLYVNLQDREEFGAVSPDQKQALVDELAAKLEEYVDPETGDHPLMDVARAYVVYHGPHTDTAPDIVMGFKRGYRGGDESALGKIPGTVITPNKSSWSGDHCVAAREVPGVIITNRKLVKPDPALIDLGPTVLKIFGLPIPADMDGKPVFE
jgi:predicted AlkP superfamily phosphohydrolase/phosphomutase